MEAISLFHQPFEVYRTTCFYTQAYELLSILLLEHSKLSFFQVLTLLILDHLDPIKSVPARSEQVP